MSTSPRAWVGARLRSVVDASVDAGLGPVREALRTLVGRNDAALEALAAQQAVAAELRARLEAVEELARIIDTEQRAVRQQLDEALDFLRLQHFAVRKALDRLPDEGPAPLDG